MKSVKILGILGLLVMCSPSFARDAQRHRGAQAPRAAQPHTRTTERQRTDTGHTRTDTWTGANGRTASRDAVRTKTDDGFTRNTTATNAQGQAAERDLTVSRNPETGTVTRETNYSTFDGRQGSKSDVIQRTEDGFTRDTARTTPTGETHTRSVDVSCEKNARKCVKQVEVGQQP